MTWLDRAVNKLATVACRGAGRCNRNKDVVVRTVPWAFHHAIRPRHNNSVSVIGTALKPLKRQRFRNAVSLKAVRALQ